MKLKDKSTIDEFKAHLESIANATTAINELMENVQSSEGTEKVSFNNNYITRMKGPADSINFGYTDKEGVHYAATIIASKGWDTKDD